MAAMHFSDNLTRFAAYARRHATALTLTVSLLIVTVWTLIRHLTNGVNFDVVGQVGLAEQWQHGLHSGAQLGPTNYLLKMPLYMVVNLLGFLAPHAKLLLLAVLCNLATFGLLYVLFSKILSLSGVRNRSWLMLGFVWLASISGSVYWLDYANSRNLETVGGIALLYVALQLLRAPRIRTALWLALIGSVVFFADPLQVYVTAAPIVLYAVLGVVYSRRHALAAGLLLGATGAAYIGSKVLFKVTATLLHIQYLAVPSPLPRLTLHAVLNTLRSTSINTLKVFDAYFFKRPLGPNAIRELINAAVLAAIVALAVRLLVRWRETTQLQRILLVAIAMNYAVFAASGQALQWETSRYLLMVPLFAVLLVAASSDIILPQALRLRPVVIAGIGISCLLLAGALAVSWPKRYQKDTFITATVAYMRAHGYRYAASSREVGIPASYFGYGSTTIVPLLCQPDHTMHQSDLFYDKAAFNTLLAQDAEIPVIVQPGGIKYGANYCTDSDVVRQFGQPLRQEAVPGVGTAELYTARQLRIAE